ncbi:hypothetical protein QAD02_005359 [Eretmocerus hayati]|uniref:Uncharacterized protein n=1 Tax=Eretmocerus hayati TaxID=131215 RepID=A0ACC2NV38_9HYME|nr:hypothetical protein QAD02_005359 [Eretmocerus hayati]
MYLRRSRVATKERLLQNTILAMKTASNEIEMNEKYCIYMFSFDVQHPTLRCDLEFGRNLKREEEPNIMIKHYSETNNALCIYTDGRKVPGKNSVGVACVCEELDMKLRIVFPQMLQYSQQNV